jgi:hypothetical protein
MALMHATKRFTLGRVIAGSGAVAHGGQLSSGEQLKLTHESIIPARPTFIDPVKKSIMPFLVAPE